jgi:hypothetical protein
MIDITLEEGTIDIGTIAVIETGHIVDDYTTLMTIIYINKMSTLIKGEML